jgi:hypothetical protein
MIKTKSSSGLVFSATDTYNLSLSDSADPDPNDVEEDDDEPTDPFV